jgi:hypothetical protein
MPWFTTAERGRRGEARDRVHFSNSQVISDAHPRSRMGLDTIVCVFKAIALIEALVFALAPSVLSSPQPGAPPPVLLVPR